MPALACLCRRGLWLLAWFATGAAAAVTSPPAPTPGAAPPSCRVVNLMPDFWKSLGKPDAAADLRATLITPHPDLYNENYVSLPTGEKWPAEVARERAYVEPHRTEVTAAENYLVANVPSIMSAFQKTFPDYRCDFTFYIAPSFGRMDGSAAFVNGEHRIIFAPDVIPRYHQLANLKVLIDHETFHIYHHQASGVFGASPEAVPKISEALWGEGLATFVSWRMNPKVSLDIALLQPGIPEAARPHLREIAKALLAHLDEQDEPTFKQYFVAGREPKGYPPRAGYYVGVLLAQAMSARHSLQELARLNGPPLRAELVAELETLANSH